LEHKIPKNSTRRLSKKEIPGFSVLLSAVTFHHHQKSAYEKRLFTDRRHPLEDSKKKQRPFHQLQKPSLSIQLALVRINFIGSILILCYLTKISPEIFQNYAFDP
jgi:hypothetical protein